MNFLDYIMNHKTYIVAAIVILIGVAEGYLGLDVPGVVVGADPIAYILAGLGIGLGRKAITDEVKGRI